MNVTWHHPGQQVDVEVDATDIATMISAVAQLDPKTSFMEECRKIHDFLLEDPTRTLSLTVTRFSTQGRKA